MRHDQLKFYIKAFTLEKKPEALFLWKLMLDNMRNKNPNDNVGISILHKIAICFPDEIEKFKMVMELIEDKNPKTHVIGSTPLHWAAEKGHFDICKLILQNVDNKNPRNQFGRTPLSDAEKNGHEEICNLIKSALKN